MGATVGDRTEDILTWPIIFRKRVFAVKQECPTGRGGEAREGRRLLIGNGPQDLGVTVV